MDRHQRIPEFSRRQWAGGCIGWLGLLRSSAAVAPSMPSRPPPLRVAVIQMDPWGMSGSFDARPVAGLSGIVPELLDELERRTGLPTHRVLTPYARVEAELAAGLADCSILAWSEHRAAYAIKGCKLLALDFGVLPLRSIGPVGRVEDLLSLPVAVPRGLHVATAFDADARIPRYAVLDYAMGVRMAALRRGVYAVAGSIASIRAAARRQGLEGHFGSGLVLSQRPVTLSFSKLSAHLAQFDRIDAILNEMAADYTVQHVADRWLPLS